MAPISLKKLFLIPNTPTHAIFMHKPRKCGACVFVYASCFHRINLHQFIIRNIDEWQKWEKKNCLSWKSEVRRNEMLSRILSGQTYQCHLLNWFHIENSRFFCANMYFWWNLCIFIFVYHHKSFDVNLMEKEFKMDYENMQNIIEYHLYWLLLKVKLFSLVENQNQNIKRQAYLFFIKDNRLFPTDL